MIIEVLAHAPDQATAHAFMQAVGIVDDQLRPLVEVQIDEVGEIAKTPAVIDFVTAEIVTPAVMVPGFHVNVRYYGTAAEHLTDGLAQTDVDGAQLGLFERTHILDLVDQRTGRSLAWSAVTDDPIPPGYVDPVSGVKLFDPARVASRRRVWA